MILLDSDILTSFLHGEKNYVKEVHRLLEAQAVATTAIQVAEIASQAEEQEQAEINKLFELFEILPFTKEAGITAGNFWRQYQVHYPGITINHCLIAATAKHAEAKIYTDQPQYYPMTEVQLHDKTIKSITLKSKPRLSTID